MRPNEHFVRGFLHEIKLAEDVRPGNERRTYTIEGKPHQLDELERAMSMMDWLGMAGASRAVKISYDGDGAARLRFARKDGKLQKVDDADDRADKDEISFGID